MLQAEVNSNCSKNTYTYIDIYYVIICPLSELPVFNRLILFSRLTTLKIHRFPSLPFPFPPFFSLAHLLEPLSYFCWSLVTQLARVVFVFFFFVFIYFDFREIQEQHSHCPI